MIDQLTSNIQLKFMLINKMPSSKGFTARSGKSAVIKPKEIVYPILSECADLVRDEFWKQLYQDLSAGKVTKGIFISHGVIQSSNKRNGFQYSITDKAPEVIVVELHHLITTHTSICSRKDVSKKQAFIDDLEKELSDYGKGKWTSIKRKNLRMILLVDYALHLQKLHNLDWTATMAAHRTIVRAFDDKTHSSRDVEYEDGKIISIQDIELDDNGKNIINLREDSSQVTENTVSESNRPGLLKSLWEPYVAAWLKTLKS